MVKNLIQILFLIFKAVLHYFDCGSDLMLIYTVSERVNDESYPKIYKENYTIVALTMVIALIAEIILVYLILLELQFVVENENENLENKIEEDVY